VIAGSYFATPTTLASCEHIFTLMLLQLWMDFLGARALECTALSKCKQRFAEQLTSSSC